MPVLNWHERALNPSMPRAKNGGLVCVAQSRNTIRARVEILVLTRPNIVSVSKPLCTLIEEARRAQTRWRAYGKSMGLIVIRTHLRRVMIAGNAIKPTL